jgi:hypothetical protein
MKKVILPRSLSDVRQVFPAKAVFRSGGATAAPAPGANAPPPLRRDFGGKGALVAADAWPL